MTNNEIQILKWYAVKQGTTWDNLVKQTCENYLKDALTLARAEITKDMTVEDICYNLEQPPEA